MEWKDSTDIVMKKKISIKQTGKLIVQTSAKDEDKLLEIYNLGKKWM